MHVLFAQLSESRPHAPRDDYFVTAAGRISVLKKPDRQQIVDLSRQCSGFSCLVGQRHFASMDGPKYFQVHGFHPHPVLVRWLTGLGTNTAGPPRCSSLLVHRPGRTGRGIRLLDILLRFPLSSDA